jgi:hypothetical protein
MPKHFSTSTQVSNIQGTSDPHFKIPNLKQKYQAVSGSQRNTCSAQGCPKPYEATAHVQINDGKKNGGGHNWYLVPTCNEHNSYTAHPHFEVNPSTVFVAVEEVRSL